MNPAAMPVGGAGAGVLALAAIHSAARALNSRSTRRRLRTDVAPGHDDAEPARGAAAGWRRRGRRLDQTIVLADQLGAVAREVRTGSSLTRAIAATDDTDPDWALARAVLATLAENGGPAAEPLDRVASTLRERAALREERKVQAAAAVLSARMLTWLPVLVATWSVLTSADVRHVLLRTPFGWTCLVVGTLLNLAGRRWTRRIVEQAR